MADRSQTFTGLPVYVYMVDYMKCLHYWEPINIKTRHSKGKELCTYLLFFRLSIDGLFKQKLQQKNHGICFIASNLTKKKKTT